jgi:hypothetical protein
MHYSDERQEHNEKDWPDNEEWMEAMFQNGPTGNGAGGRLRISVFDCDNNLIHRRG